MKKRSQLKGKFNFWLLNFHKEIMKTTAIGKKMLTAGRTNAHLKDTYEELGRLLERGVENGDVDWDSPKMRALLHTIKACKKDLEEIERKMNNIKFMTVDYKYAEKNEEKCANVIEEPTKKD
ncbi:MAG: hypothetical protein K2Q18_04565 [Bdellovibrionales bacterium]|nr:hypothetical protein [Bdellovibrionales bacterium]